MKVLSVDDSKSVQAFIRDCFKDTEFTVSQVTNGQECVDDLKSNQYDLILLDWEMPVMNGPETLQALAAGGHAVPIVMLTTKNKPEDIEKALTLGACEYLMKPFTKEILIEKIREVLQ